MFETITRQIENKLKASGKKFDAEPGFLSLFDFEESAENKRPLLLENAVLITKKILLIGQSDLSLFDGSQTFFEFQNANRSFDLSNQFSIKLSDTNLKVFESDFVSVHRGFFKVKYNLSSFVIPNAADIYAAGLQYLVYRIK